MCPILRDSGTYVFYTGYANGDFWSVYHLAFQFQIFTNMSCYLVMILCSLVGSCRCLGGMHCIYLLDKDGDNMFV